MLIKSIFQVQQKNDTWMLENYVIPNNNLFVNPDSIIFDEGKNNTTKESVVIKSVACKNIDMEEFEKIINMTPIQFPFILNLQDAFLCKSNDTLYLVFNKSSGSLSDYYMKAISSASTKVTKKIFPEHEALKIFFQIFEGVLWLWGNDIFHCNISPSSLLYRYEENLKKNVFFISDFGASTLQSCPIIAGSRISPYMAPEVIISNTRDYLCDVWSLGLVLHELLFGEVYFSDSNDDGIINKITNIKYKLTEDQKGMISAKTAALLERMIVFDSKYRIAKEELKKAVREFYEYEYTREILVKFRHAKRFLTNNQNGKDIILQYAKKLMNSSWDMILNGYHEFSRDSTGEALQIYLDIYGEDVAETKYAMIRHAQSLMFSNQIDLAKMYGDRALKLYENNKSKMDPDLAKVYMIIGDIYNDLEIYETSKDFLEKSVRMRLNINGEYHRETASAFNNLGITLRDLNDLLGAKECYEKSIKIKIKLFGSRHFEITSTYYNLSLVLFKLKDYKKALNFCQKAKATREKHYGKSHFKTKEVERRENIIKQTMKKKLLKSTA